MKKIIYLLVVIMSMNMCIFVNAEDEITSEITYTTGAILMTEEEVENLKANIPQIIDVKPNRLYYNRLLAESENAELFEESTDVILENLAEEGMEIIAEITTDMSDAMEIAENDDIPLPKTVDNSVVDENGMSTFPEIGNQMGLKACVGWSFGYYQLTNNANRIRGTIARNVNGNISENIYSPNWVYNLGNNGTNNGMKVQQAMNILYTYGCPATNLVPINTTVKRTNYGTWYPVANIWESALYNKCDIYYGKVNPENLDTAIINKESVYIKELKEILADGYVVSFETMVYTTDNLKINEIVKMGVDSEGKTGYAWTEFRKDGEGHALTIVGYDDDFYVDINGNSEPEEGEYGAFKVANSWGVDESYHNNGCFWLPYDALNKVSAVKSNQHINRKKAIDNDLFYLIMPKKNYEPLLLATVELKASNRSGTVTMGIAVSEEKDWFFEEQNIADTTYMRDNNVETTISPIAFNGSQATCNFIGTTSSHTGTFVFDLTGILNKMNLEKDCEYILYLKFDNNRNAIVKSLILKDLYNGKTYVAESEYIGNEYDYSYVELEYVSDIITRKGDYTFVLNFNSDVSADSVNDTNISIINNQGQKINVDVALSSRKASRILVGDDEDTYENGFYKLIVFPGLKSKGGNSLGKTIEEPFYIPFH